MILIFIILIVLAWALGSFWAGLAAFIVLAVIYGVVYRIRHPEDY